MKLGIKIAAALVCAAGSAEADIVSMCTPCAAGTYSNADATACTPCPTDATSPAGAPSIQSCSCRDGYTPEYDIQVSQASRDRCASFNGRVIGANCIINSVNSMGCYYLGGYSDGYGCAVPLNDSVLTLKKCNAVMCGAGQYRSGTTCSACPPGKYMNSTSHSSTSCYNTCKDVVIAFGKPNERMSYEVFSPDGKQHTCATNFCMHPLNFRNTTASKVEAGRQYSITCDPKDGTPYLNGTAQTEKWAFHPCGNVMIMYGPSASTPRALDKITLSEVSIGNSMYYLLAFNGNSSDNVNRGAHRDSYTFKCSNGLFGDPASGKAKSCFIPADPQYGRVGMINSTPIANENEEFEVVCDTGSRNFKIKTSATYGSRTYKVWQNGLMVERQ